MSVTKDIDDDVEKAPLVSPADAHPSPTDSLHIYAQSAAPPTLRRTIFTTLPLFMGYAGMITQQEHIKTKLGISKDSPDAYIFGVGTSFLYLGNLIFRLLHNILFTCMKPRQRVMLAYASMVVSQLVIGFAYYVANSTHLAWVFVAYIVAGVGIGTFESNLMSCLTPLGHTSKSWAVLGIPVGFNMISIGTYIMFAVKPDDVTLQMSVYFFIACANVFGLFFYAFFIPNIEFAATNDTVMTFFVDLKKITHWFPTIWKHCLALAIDMCCVSIFSSVFYYIYDLDHIPLWYMSETTIPVNAFRAIYNTLSFLGDFTSRRIAYRDKERNPLYFLVLSCVGTGIILSKQAIIAPLGMFLVMFANGSIYAQSTKYVDNKVGEKYNLMALSAWLFLGDVGSFCGAQGVQAIQAGIGPLPTRGSPATGPMPTFPFHNHTVTRTLLP